jgi:hypothetical protein
MRCAGVRYADGVPRTEATGNAWKEDGMEKETKLLRSILPMMALLIGLSVADTGPVYAADTPSSAVSFEEISGSMISEASTHPIEILETPDKVEVLVDFSDEEQEIDIPLDEWERFIHYEEEYHPEELVVIEEELIHPLWMSVVYSTVFLEELEEFIVTEEASPLRMTEAAPAEASPIRSVPQTGAVKTAPASAGAAAAAAMLLILKKKHSF